MNEPKHALSVLRRMIGLKQKEMGDLIGCSLATIQAVEYGKLKPSDKLIKAISYQTGVSMLWLWATLGQPPVDELGKPYTRETYDQHRSVLFAPRSKGLDLVIARSCFRHAVERLAILFTKALREKKVDMCNYKVGCATEELLQELGMHKSLSEEERQRWLSFSIAREPQKRSGYGWRAVMESQWNRITGSVGGEELVGVLDRFLQETGTIYEQHAKKPVPDRSSSKVQPRVPASPQRSRSK